MKERILISMTEVEKGYLYSSKIRCIFDYVLDILYVLFLGSL